ncbi:polyunsaturated fatty acid 5-lipoxygenase-like [Cyprinus carpio]|uniref:Polyunsaturated fatty acid 5-lipoxygenase-like n=1 Tax=Cyprinus carpio TaxID=7962 RepID=A0A9Q9XYG7_CYPCA|nr:polyunsaturated fatty acid 5-lipoxygenase-like [Cyprinus carpio]
MPTYKVTVYTVRQFSFEKMDNIYLTLLDSEKQSSKRTLVDQSWFSRFKTEFSLDIHVEKNIGNIVQVKLEKDHHNHPWFCEHIKVQTSGDCFEFPCYWWLVNENEVMIREGTARLPQDDTKSFQEQRKDELESRQKIFRFDERDFFCSSLDTVQCAWHTNIKHRIGPFKTRKYFLKFTCTI